MVEQNPTTQLAPSELLEQLLAPQPFLMAYEGGPCGGKTTAIQSAGKMALTAQRTVVIYQEAAGEHIADIQAQGKDPLHMAEHDREAWIGFEGRILQTNIDRVRHLRREYAGTNAVGLFDRVDVETYLRSLEYRGLLRDKGLERPLLQEMDAVFYRPSLGRVDEAEFERLRTGNPTRWETSAAHAAQVCIANLAAARTHPNLHMIWGGDFETGINRQTNFAEHPERVRRLAYMATPELALARLRWAEAEGALLNTMTIGESYHELNGTEFTLRTSSGVDDWLRRTLLFWVDGPEGREEYQRELTEEQYELLSTVRSTADPTLKFRRRVLEPVGADGRRRLWDYDHYPESQTEAVYLTTVVYDDEDAAEVRGDMGSRYRAADNPERPLALSVPQQGTLGW